MVFLKNGKILESSKILVASGNKIKVRTSDNKEQVVLRKDIKRLRYGEDTIESINILLNNGNIIKKAFIVEQNNSRVLIRRDKFSESEEDIAKSEIDRMSRKDIVLYYPQITVRGGMMMPLNSGNADLGAAPMIIGGFGIKLPFLFSWRARLEAGFLTIKRQCECRYGFFRQYQSQPVLSIHTIFLIHHYHLWERQAAVSL